MGYQRRVHGALKNWGRELMVFKPRIALYYGEL